MRYPFSVYKTRVDDHVFWIAKSILLKGCVGQGDTQEDALTELADNEKAWLDTAKELGMEIPEIPIEDADDYSGKTTLRMSPSVHRMAAHYARREGISLNQYINDAVVSQNAVMSAML